MCNDLRMARGILFSNENEKIVLLSLYSYLYLAIKLPLKTLFIVSTLGTCVKRSKNDNA